MKVRRLRDKVEIDEKGKKWKDELCVEDGEDRQ